MKCTLLIRDCQVLQPDFEVAEHMAVAIDGSEIVEVGPAAELVRRYEAEQVISGKGKLCMPGLVDAHTHTCQQLLKGRTMEELPMIWSRILVPFESNMEASDVYTSAQLSCLEMIKSGTTTFNDAGGVHMHRVADSAIEAGMRATITRSCMDVGEFLPSSMKQPKEDILRSNEELYLNYHGAGDGRIRIWFGMRQVMSCSPEYIQLAAEMARAYNTGLHAHLAEHRDEVRYCLEKYKLRPAQFLDSLGFLGPNLVTAHNVTYSEAEIDLLHERGVNIVHCPRANFNSHGFPKTPRMLHLGMTIGIGSDGAAGSNLSLWDEVRVFRAGLVAYWGLPVFDPMVMPAKELVKMITRGGAEALGLGHAIGTVEAGKKADLIMVNIDQPHLSPTRNLVATMIQSMTSKDVEDVLIDGKVVMRGREVLTLDEERILYESKLKMDSISLKAGI